MRRIVVPGTGIVPPVRIGAKSDFLTSLQYSQNGQVVNPYSYKAAASAIGGDEVTTKIWFDKN